jgi:DNA mismatch repair ATPase MutS
MAGLPFHALDTGIARLIARGYPVAVAEQLLDAGRVAEFEPAEGVLSSVPASRGEPEPQQLSLPLQ